MKPIPPLLIVVLFVLSSATAMQPIGDLTATGVQTNGTTMAEGGFVSFMRESGSAANAQFTIAARDLRIEVDAANPTVWAPPLILYSFPPETLEYDMAAAVARGVDARPDHGWLLFPLEGTQAAVTSTCLSIQTSDQGDTTRFGRVRDTREPLVAALDGATAVASCSSGATLTVTGDFLLVLWEWDVLVEHDGGSEMMWSGRGRSAVDPAGSDETRQFVSEDREVFLFARDAVLEVDLQAGETVYLGASEVETSGTTVLRNAVGSLDVAGRSIALDREDAVLSGLVQMRLDGSVGDTLSIAVSGDLDRVEAQGETWVAPDVVPAWRTAAILALLIIAGLWLVWYLLPLAYYGKLWWQGRVDVSKPVGLSGRRGVALRIAALEAHWTDHNRAALLLASLSNRVHPSVRAQVLVADLASRLGRHERALRTHTVLDGVLGSPGDLARNATAAAVHAETLGYTLMADGWRRRASRYELQGRAQRVPAPSADDWSDVV